MPNIFRSLWIVSQVLVFMAGLTYYENVLAKDGHDEDSAYSESDSKDHDSRESEDHDSKGIRDDSEKEDDHDSREVNDDSEKDSEKEKSKSNASKMVICHFPPGGGRAHSLMIDSHAWKAHQKHHDYIGACKKPVNIITGCQQGDSDRQKYHEKLMKALEHYYTPVVLKDSELEDSETKRAFDACLAEEKGHGYEIEDESSESEDHESKDDKHKNDEHKGGLFHDDDDKKIAKHEDDDFEKDPEDNDSRENEHNPEHESEDRSGHESKKDDRFHILAACGNHATSELSEQEDLSGDKKEYRSYLKAKEREHEANRREDEKEVFVFNKDLEDEDVKRAFDECLDSEHGNGHEDYVLYSRRGVHILMGCKDDDEEEEGHHYKTRLEERIHHARESDKEGEKGRYVDERIPVVFVDDVLSDAGVRKAVDECLDPDKGNGAIIRINLPKDPGAPKSTIVDGKDIIDIIDHHNPPNKVIDNQPNSSGIDGRIGWREVVGP